MINNTTLQRMCLALPLAALTMGGGCPAGVPFDDHADGYIAVVFDNDTPFEVDPTIDGQRTATVGPDVTTDPVLIGCTSGEHFDFSGSMRTNTQTLPSPFEISFDEGYNCRCGGTIVITFYVNGDGDLDLDSTSF